MSPDWSKPPALVPDNVTLRLDKWLWAARFFKTRGLAVEAIALGRVRSDGARCKPAHGVRPGETLLIETPAGRFEVVVRAVVAVRGPAAVARLLYEETDASRQQREARALARGSEPAQSIKGRPTKRDGRALRRLSGLD